MGWSGLQVVGLDLQEIVDALSAMRHEHRKAAADDDPESSFSLFISACICVHLPLSALKPFFISCCNHRRCLRARPPMIASGAPIWDTQAA
jgi:hypothetical protein